MAYLLVLCSFWVTSVAITMSADKLSGTEFAPDIVEGGVALICTYDSGKYPICPFLFRPWMKKKAAKDQEEQKFEVSYLMTVLLTCTSRRPNPIT